MSRIVGLLPGLAAATFLAAGSALADCPWAIYPNNTAPFHVVVADFNNDGNSDLAVTNNGNGRIGVYLGNGSGGFQPPITTPPLAGFSHLVAVDLDRDGNVDVATNGATVDAITVLYGLGNGSFQPGVGFPVGDIPYGVTSGDFNADGIPDLAAANFGAGSMSVILGLATGGFGAPVHYPAGVHPFEIKTADFNEDGFADLVVTNQDSHDISIFLALGDGGFAPQVRYAAQTYPYTVATADFDGDGITDLAVGNGGSGTITLFKGGGAGGVGNGAFVAVSTISGIGEPRTVVACDFDFDNLADLAIADFGGSVRLLRGMGNGTFAPSMILALARGITDVAVGDFNGDQPLDFAAPNYLTDELAVYPAVCPAVQTLSPSSGPPGTLVTIGGWNFIDVVSVQFNGADAEFTVLSDAEITATVPEAARTGPVTVRDILGVGTGPIFTVAPRILSFLPRQAPIGFGPVRIRGYGFDGATSVLFKGVSAGFNLVSDELIEATVPDGATDGPLTVIAPGGTGVSDSVFVVGPLGPSGINLSWDNCGAFGSGFKSFACDSNSGRPFNLVASFVPPPAVDGLQGLTAELRVESGLDLPDWWSYGAGQCRSAQSLTAYPGFVGAAGCGNAFPSGSANAVLSYAVGYHGPNTARLVVSVFQPSNHRGPVSPDTEYYAFQLLVDRARSTGTGSCSGCGTPVSITLESLQLLQPVGVGFSPILTQPRDRNVAYWQGIPGPLPEILSFSPTAGDVGTPVTITGSHFSGTTSVRFNAVAATFSVVTDSVITTTVPSGGRSGLIHVTSPAGTGASQDIFVVAPLITSFEPRQTPVGTPVTIQGVNFTATNAVSFNGAPATFTVDDDTRITAVVPKGAVDGPITVVNAGGSDTTDDDFHIGPRVGSGINLSWNDCGVAGSSNQTFACDVNTGPPLVAIASFSPMTTLPEFLGMSADVRIVSPSGPLPDWWKHGVDECRGFAGLGTGFNFTSGPYNCVDFNGDLADGGFAYDVGYQSPENARLRIQFAVPFEARGPIVPGNEYYAFKVNVLRSKTTGAGSCSGCEVPMCIRLNSVQFFQPPELGHDPVLMEPLQNNVVSWQSPAINCLLATPVLVSVVTAEATADRVRLVWQTEDVERATVHRRDAGGAWRMVATLYPDGQGRVTYEDTDVSAGATYDYRLGVPAPTGEIFVGETRVTVPAAAPAFLSMARVTWDGMALAVSLSLPRSGTAQLELFDVNGRRLAEERLEGLVAGEHDVRIRPGHALRPGVFFARLTQDHERVGKRFVVLQ